MTQCPCHQARSVNCIIIKVERDYVHLKTSRNPECTRERRKHVSNINTKRIYFVPGCWSHDLCWLPGSSTEALQHPNMEKHQQQAEHAQILHEARLKALAVPSFPKKSHYRLLPLSHKLNACQPLPGQCRQFSHY